MANYKDDDRDEFHSTTEELYNHMYSILQEYHKEPIVEFIETSAGDGRMIDFLKGKGHEVIGFDNKNRLEREDITTCNYLKEKIEYKKGRVSFQNPPFNNGLKFVYKSLEESDYCVSILSLNSFLNIDYDKYEVDTIDIFRDYDFVSCKVSICIVGLKKKVSND
jgi:hypothetical protein